MASTFTDLGLELMATGENAGTWGTKTNANLSLVEQLTGGYLSLAVAGSGTTALSISDGALTGTAQHRVIELTGALTGSRILTFPLLTENFYFIKNSTTNAQTLQLKAVSGSGATVTWATTDKGWKIIYVDGVATNTGVYEIPMTSVDDVTLTGTQTLTNKTINASQLVDGSIATAKLADDLVTLAKMAPGTDGNLISYDASGNPVAVATGNSGQVLTSAGAGAPPTFATIAEGRTGAVSWDTTVKTSGFTAASGIGYFCNTTSAAFTVTLPSSPSAGDIIAVADYANNFATNNLTLARNGSNIGGNAGNATLLVDGAAVTLVFVDATKGWIVTDSGLQSDAEELATYITATGGTVTTVDTDFKVHTFTGPGTFTVCSVGSSAGSNTVSYVVVAGGGGGGATQNAGNNRAGGGGAGGYRESKAASDSYTASPLNATSGPGYNLPVSAQGYPITVGAGGPGAYGCGATNGSNAVFSTITSAGGGKGGECSPAPYAGAGTGGSGGGASARGSGAAGNTPPVSPPQGQNGSNSTGFNGTGGGGGGAGAAGSTAPTGAGGSGVASSINNTPTLRAGGGGAPGGAANNGGSGGGGAANAGAGTANTGGGGAGNYGPSASGGTGGSGIVIIRYKFQN